MPISNVWLSCLKNILPCSLFETSLRWLAFMLKLEPWHFSSKSQFNPVICFESITMNMILEGLLNLESRTRIQVESVCQNVHMLYFLAAVCCSSNETFWTLWDRSLFLCLNLYIADWVSANFFNGEIKTGDGGVFRGMARSHVKKLPTWSFHAHRTQLCRIWTVGLLYFSTHSGSVCQCDGPANRYCASSSISQKLE